MYVKHRYSIKEVHLNTWLNIIIVLIISTLIVYLYEIENWVFLKVPVAIPTILGTTISLILAFRTNASYDRWWEARKVWGAIVNDSRSLVRQALVNFDKAELEKLANRQIGWNYTLSNSLRETDNQGILEKYLSTDEVNFVQNNSNKPNAILLLHEKQLKQMLENGTIDTIQYAHMSRTVQQLCDAMGKCERIKNTIFPTQYGFYIHSTIMVFVFSLPFGLMADLDWIAILVTGIVTFLFLTIEHMSIDLQRPFENAPNDTPMTALSRTIEINILQMIGAKDIPQPLKPKDGYLM